MLYVIYVRPLFFFLNLNLTLASIIKMSRLQLEQFDRNSLGHFSNIGMAIS